MDFCFPDEGEDFLETPHLILQIFRNISLQEWQNAIKYSQGILLMKINENEQ